MSSDITVYNFMQCFGRSYACCDHNKTRTRKNAVSLRLWQARLAGPSAASSLRPAHSTSHDWIRSRVQTNKIVKSWPWSSFLLQCRKVSQAKIKQYSYIWLICLILRSWRWRQYFLPKRLWTTRLHGVHSQTTVSFPKMPLKCAVDERIRRKELGLWLACKHRGQGSDLLQWTHASQGTDSEFTASRTHSNLREMKTTFLKILSLYTNCLTGKCSSKTYYNRALTNYFHGTGSFLRSGQSSGCNGAVEQVWFQSSILYFTSFSEIIQANVSYNFAPTSYDLE
jgi:hypothetical protein